jgi:hypothetical protein
VHEPVRISDLKIIRFRNQECKSWSEKSGDEGNIDPNIIEISFVRSSEQLANILTKSVSSKMFNESIMKLDMIDIYMST